MLSQGKRSSIWLVLLVLLAVTGCAQDDDEALSGTVSALAEQNAALATQNAELATRLAPGTTTPTLLPTATTSTTPTASPTLTAVPSPTATGTPLPTSTRPHATAPPPPPPPTTVPEPLLVDWYISNIAELPDNGRQVSLVWRVDQVPPGAEVRIVANTQYRFQPWWVVEPSGQMTVDLDRTIYPDPWLVLRVYNPVANLDYASWSLPLPWACQHDYFFEPAEDYILPCPQEAPQTSVAAEQYFENGRMLWIESLDQVIVFYEDGRAPNWYSFEDRWEEGDPETDPSIIPPPNRYQPVRGFNKVWLEQPGVRERLGWGVAPEEIFTATFQRPEHEYALGATTLYVRMIDGQTRSIFSYDVGSGFWETVP